MANCLNRIPPTIFSDEPKSAKFHPRDIDGIRHQCEVQAEILFEAVAAGANVFRKTLWAGHSPGPACEFTVKLVPETTHTYTIALHKVEEFASHGVANGAKGIIRKQKLKEMLGIAD